MVSIFGTLITQEDTDSFKYGEIIAISGNRIDVRTTSGLEVTITEESAGYVIGDQLILGVQNGDLNNLFILKKMDNAYPSSINYLVGLDTD